MPENNVTLPILSRPTIGVGVLLWRDRQLLLGKRIDKHNNSGQNSCWQFPGGHLEQEETVIECAAREVMEETGLEIKRLRHFGFTDKTFVMADSRYITLLVSGDYVSGEAQTLEPEKCEGWQWFDYQRLPEPLFKPIEIFLLQQDDLYALHESSRVLSADSLIR